MSTSLTSCIKRLTCGCQYPSGTILHVSCPCKSVAKGKKNVCHTSFAGRTLDSEHLRRTCDFGGQKPPTLCRDLCCNGCAASIGKREPVEVVPDGLALCWILLAMQVTQKCWTFFSLKVDTPGGSFLLMKSPFLYTIMMLLIVRFYTNTSSMRHLRLHCDYRYVPTSHRAQSASLDAILLFLLSHSQKTSGLVRVRCPCCTSLSGHEAACTHGVCSAFGCSHFGGCV